MPLTSDMIQRWINEDEYRSYKKVIFDLPSAEECKGYSIAMKAILSNDRIKGIGFKPMYSMEDAIRRTIEILR